MGKLTFGTAGIRAKIDELTPKEAYEITLKLSGYFGENIAIGRDARINGRALYLSVESALLYTGKKIHSLSLSPTPTVQYYLEKHSLDGAFVITASHNPPEWNGIKVFRKDNITLPKEEGNEMLENPKIPPYSPTDRVKEVDANKEHAEALLSFETEEFNILVDYGNGVAPLVFNRFLEEKKKEGLRADLLNEKIDGTFPGRNSEPTPSNLKELFEKIEGYDMGIAFDGDGDRVVFVDEEGNFVSGDKTLAIIASYMLEKEKGIVVSTVATSKVVDEVVEKKGGKVIHTKVGTTYIAKAIKENNAILGGEEAGGVIYPKVHLGKDGLLTAALMLKIVKEKGPLSHLLKELPYYYFEKRKIDISKEAKRTFMERFIPHLKELYREAKFNEADGIRVDFGDAWLLVRPSGTENKLRYFVEAKSKEKAFSLIEELEKEILKFTQ